MSLVDLMSMAKPNEELRKKILQKLHEELAYCFQCAKCTSGCTAFKLLELVPHEIMRLTKLGFIEELITSEIIWTCATCLKCVERCPQNVSPYHVIIALRNIAVKQEAKIPEAYLKAVSQILETGLAQTIEKVTTKKMESLDRQKLHLPEIKHPTETFRTTFLKILEEHEL
ncbi:hypothetical protein DRO54_08520 [Candidatus Bathyarchaeota archaeon]|nr:MAG: hypothetical protein DRO54_08520 [Candidatus Bathyarchaeota archaeon]